MFLNILTNLLIVVYKFIVQFRAFICFYLLVIINMCNLKKNVIQYEAYEDYTKAIEDFLKTV